MKFMQKNYAHETRERIYAKIYAQFLNYTQIYDKFMH